MIIIIISHILFLEFRKIIILKKMYPTVLNNFRCATNYSDYKLQNGYTANGILG